MKCPHTHNTKATTVVIFMPVSIRSFPTDHLKTAFQMISSHHFEITLYRANAGLFNNSRWLLVLFFDSIFHRFLFSFFSTGFYWRPESRIRRSMNLLGRQWLVRARGWWPYGQALDVQAITYQRHEHLCDTSRVFQTATRPTANGCCLFTRLLSIRSLFPSILLLFGVLLFPPPHPLTAPDCQMLATNWRLRPARLVSCQITW